jgi:hypothetical protein
MFSSLFFIFHDMSHFEPINIIVIKPLESE